MELPGEKGPHLPTVAILPLSPGGEGLHLLTAAILPLNLGGKNHRLTAIAVLPRTIAAGLPLMTVTGTLLTLAAGLCLGRATGKTPPKVARANLHLKVKRTYKPSCLT